MFVHRRLNMLGLLADLFNLAFTVNVLVALRSLT